MFRLISTFAFVALASFSSVAVSSEARPARPLRLNATTAAEISDSQLVSHREAVQVVTLWDSHTKSMNSTYLARPL